MDLERFRHLTGESVSPEAKALANAMTVSQLNEYVRSLLAKSSVLSDVTVRGEISNFTFHRASGHLYFSLKDESGVLSAVMFRSSAQRLRFAPESGLKVLARGTVSVFVRDGKYQLYVTEMVPDGIGSLYLAFEQLKKKLAEEGLFDEQRKKALPPMPRRIGVITSPTGAAVRDIIQILGRRYPLAEVILYPALVQGEGAAATLCGGLLYFQQTKTVDVIIIGRGGGSFEDLCAFNDEQLARVIAATTIPVVSAVGHETDYTICDFVADCRAPTPSAAAELVAPPIQDLLLALKNTRHELQQKMAHRLSLYRKTVAGLAARPVFTRPDGLYREQTLRLLAAEERLQNGMRTSLNQGQSAFREVAAKLNMLNPLGVLLRGYSAVYDREGNVITTANALAPGDAFCVQLCDGRIYAKAEQITAEAPAVRRNEHEEE